MKKEKFSKKLKLNKNTISSLNNNKLDRIKGGRTTYPTKNELCLTVPTNTFDSNLITEED